MGRPTSGGGITTVVWGGTEAGERLLATEDFWVGRPDSSGGDAVTGGSTATDGSRLVVVIARMLSV